MRNRTICLVAAAVVLVVLAACVPAAPPPTATPAPKATPAPPVATPTPFPAVPTPMPSPTPTPVALKWGNTPSTSDIGIFMAIEKGFFAEQGIKQEVVTFGGTYDVIPALSSGDLDVGNVIMGPQPLNTKERGIDLRVVADKGTARAGYNNTWILLRKDLADSGRVKTPADLKGMKVAIFARGNISQLALELVLAKGGLTEKDLAEGAYEIIELPPNYLPALANKAIAAGYVLDPFATTAVQQGVAIKWFPASELFPGGRVAMVTVGYSPKMAKNTDLGRRWMVAYLKGVRYYHETLKTRQGKDEIAAAIAKYTPFKDPKLLEGMEPPYVDPNGTVDMTSFKFQYDWLVKMGAYTGKVTFDDLIDTSFAEYAVQKLGRQ